MRPIGPRTGAPEVTIAEDQLEYMPLVAAVYEFKGGGYGYLTRWTLSDDERRQIAEGEDVYIAEMLPEGLPFTPLTVDIGPPGWTVES